MFILHMWYWHGFQAHISVAERISCVKLKLAKTYMAKKAVSHATHITPWGKKPISPHSEH